MKAFHLFFLTYKNIAPKQTFLKQIQMHPLQQAQPASVLQGTQGTCTELHPHGQDQPWATTRGASPYVTVCHCMSPYVTLPHWALQPDTPTSFFFSRVADTLHNQAKLYSGTIISCHSLAITLWQDKPPWPPKHVLGSPPCLFLFPYFFFPCIFC